MTKLDIRGQSNYAGFHRYQLRVSALEEEVERRSVSLQEVNFKLRQEIAERRRAEKVLRENQDRLLALVNASPDVMMVLDDRGTCLEVFTSQRQLLVADPEKQIGRPISELIPERQAQRFLDALSRTMTEGSLQSFEYELDVQEGHRWFEGRMIPLGRRDAGRSAVLIVSRDITDRKQAEEARSDSEELYRGLVESCPDGIVLTDLEYQPVMANQVAAEHYGAANVEEFLTKGASAFDCIVPEDRARALESAIKTVETGCMRNLEYRLMRNNGQVYPIEMNASLIKDKDGNPKAFIGVVRDLSDRKQAEEERAKLQVKLLETQRLESLGLLAATIAHDYKNLLMGLYGHVDLALSDLPPASPTAPFLHNIRTIADRLSEFTSQILSYSGRSEVTYAKLDLSKMVEDMIQLLRISLPRQIDLQLDLMPRPPAMEGDISQIRQVLLNLIINAAEAMEGQVGVIFIRTGTLQVDHDYVRVHNIEEQLQEGPYVQLEITDTGCGMTPEIQEKIFAPFFTTKSSGRGLGLAAVHGIIRSHEGAIKIYSEQGRGTTFTILFPCAPEVV